MEESPKNSNSVRAVPLHRHVVQALRQIEPVTRPDGSVSPWVFPVVDARKRRRYKDVHGRQQPACGDRRSPATGFFGGKLRLALEAAGVDNAVTIHGLRRTFAVLLQEAGAPDSVIRQALGHGGRGVTELNYLPRRDLLVQQWVDRIDLPLPAARARLVLSWRKRGWCQPVTPIWHQLVPERPPGGKSLWTKAK